MTDLDDELRAAVEDSEQRAVENSGGTGDSGAQGDAPAVAVPSESRSNSAEKESPRRNLGLLAALLVAVGGILALVFTSVEGAAIYSVEVDDLLAQSEDYAGKNVKVVGSLVVGTLKRRDQPCEYRFTIESEGKLLPLRYPKCVIPDTLKDAPDVQVTAEGHLSEDGYFQASHVMAKCPSKYEMQERAQNGEVAPHSMDIGQTEGSDRPLGIESGAERAPGME